MNRSRQHLSACSERWATSLERLLFRSSRSRDSDGLALVDCWVTASCSINAIDYMHAIAQAEKWPTPSGPTTFLITSRPVLKKLSMSWVRTQVSRSRSGRGRSGAHLLVGRLVRRLALL